MRNNLMRIPLLYLRYVTLHRRPVDQNDQRRRGRGDRRQVGTLRAQNLLTGSRGHEDSAHSRRLEDRHLRGHLHRRLLDRRQAGDLIPAKLAGNIRRHRHRHRRRILRRIRRQHGLEGGCVVGHERANDGRGHTEEVDELALPQRRIDAADDRAQGMGLTEELALPDLILGGQCRVGCTNRLNAEMVFVWNEV